MTLKKILDGLNIFAKYGDPEKEYICAEHDEIFAGHDVEDKVSEEDFEQLKKLGWHHKPGSGWSAFT